MDILFDTIGNVFEMWENETNDIMDSQLCLMKQKMNMRWGWDEEKLAVLHLLASGVFGRSGKISVLFHLEWQLWGGLSALGTLIKEIQLASNNRDRRFSSFGDYGYCNWMCN